MDEATQVEVRFNGDGTITIFSFSWQGKQWPVTSMGREWDAPDGRHFLVMTTGERVFELAFEKINFAWRVVGVTEGRGKA